MRVAIAGVEPGQHLRDVQGRRPGHGARERAEEEVEEPAADEQRQELGVLRDLHCRYRRSGKPRWVPDVRKPIRTRTQFYVAGVS